MKTNSDLKTFYENIYQTGESEFFSKFDNGKNKSDNDEIVLKNLGEIAGKSILDVGCGTGKLAFEIAKRGATKVYGIDYSENAIRLAKEQYERENLEYSACDFNDWEVQVDIIVSCGTLEHLDDPPEMMKRMHNHIKSGGMLILTCPHFYNIRGIVWVTLQKLLDVPMSLTDVHSISPLDMLRWGREAGLILTHIESYDYERANGKWMVEDMKKRLTNALKDAKLPNSKVDDMLEWLKDIILYNKVSDNTIRMEGANCLYKFNK